MRRYALIGRKLGHSYSKRWFDSMFAQHGMDDCQYLLHETNSLSDLRLWMATNNVWGLNITVPYKLSIIPLLDSLSDQAAAIGAVNCVVRQPDGHLCGFNTDYAGFLAGMPDGRLHQSSGSALLLGTGGAARAVAFALHQQGIQHLFVSRHKEAASVPGPIVSYDEAAALLQSNPSRLVVNATPVGMWPAVDSSPWPYPDLFTAATTLYDLTYNPSPTLLMQQAAAHHATVCDGLAMLHAQAALSYHLFFHQ